MRRLRPLIAIVAAALMVVTGSVVPASAVETPGGGTSDGSGSPTWDPSNGWTRDGVAVDGPANGEGFDLEIAATPDPVNEGETTTVTFTVTNHDEFVAEGAEELLVAVSWVPEEFAPVLDPPNDARWATLATGGANYRFDAVGPHGPGAVCVLDGMGPAATAPTKSCTVQFRHLGGEPSASRFSARIVTWADHQIVEGPDILQPLSTPADALTSTFVDVAVSDGPDDGEHFDISIEAEPTTVSRAETFEVTITVRNYDVEPAGGADALLVSLLWPDGSVVPVEDPAGPNAWRHASDGSFDERWPEASGDQCLIEGVDEPGESAVGRCTATLQQWTMPPGETVLTARIDAWAQVGDYGGEPFLEYIGIGGEYRSSATTAVPAGPSDPPDDGEGFDVSITHTPDPLRWGHRFELRVTVTNHDVPLPDADPYEDEPFLVPVRLDWDSAAFRLPLEPGYVDGCDFWDDSELDESVLPGTGGFDRCYLVGLDAPGSSVSFTVPFRVSGPRPATSDLEFTATVDHWAWYWGDGYDFAPVNPAIATHAIPVASPFELRVEQYEFLDLGAVGAVTPVLARYTVFSSEAQLRGIDDAELVVRLGWPEGMTLGGAPPAGCVAVVPRSLDCTIDDANELGANPEAPNDDEWQLLVEEWDLNLTLPAAQSQRELLSAFTIDFVSGWTYTEPIITIASDPASARPLGGFGRSVAGHAPAVLPLASPTPPGGVTMTADWADSASTPFAILDRVFPTETIASVSNAVPGGDDVEVTFRVTHSPEVTTVLPGVEVAVALDWPDILVPTGDPAECDEFVAQICTITGLDEPGSSVDISMTFEVPETAWGFGRFAISGDGVMIVESNSDGDIEHDYPPSWVEDSDAPITVLANVFETQVTLDRDRTWPDGSDVLVTVRVQWSKALPQDIPPTRVFVGLEFDWPDAVADLVDPPGIVGCDPLDDGICYLQDWFGPGDAREVTFRLDPVAVGALEVAAMPAAIGVGVPNDASELPIEWLGGDEASATVVDAQFDVDLVLDRNPIYHGGLPMRAKATLTRGPATDGGAGYDPTLPNTEVEFAFTWPTTSPPGQPTTHLTLSGAENCPGFAVDTCVKTGFDAVGATTDTTLVFTPPPAGAAHDPHPGQVSVAVERASFDVTRYTLPPLPVGPDPEECGSNPACCEWGTLECPVDPLPEPASSIERADAPTGWLGDDTEPYNLLQPVAWFTPAVANPGDVVTMFGRYFPPGETLNAEWELRHAQATVTAFPGPVVGGALGSEFRRDVVVFRRALQGPRWVQISSAAGTFGTFESAPILISPRNSTGPDLVGRGG
ncbi:hypothetical protein [Agromyces sp. LHK192]|uniref:hypothetical protein n=1 Tax=Agromyces sp. LHK192 TaxID=2498704 RepID=UPI000FDA599F|nr:hypothetical protein [Agromyces sp. LHK192]